MMTTETRTIRTRKGKTVQSPHSDMDAVRLLVVYVTEGRITSGFARDLAARCSKLSEEQIKWAHIMVVEYEERAAKPKAPVTLFPNIVALLNQAHMNGLKRPRITTPAVRITRNGEYSRRPGWLAVVLRDEDRFLGYINPNDGSFEREPHPEMLELEKDPASAGKMFGDRTGHCCFCARELTTAESVSVGYGPVCADKFGLPWGPDENATRIEKARRLKQKFEELQS